MRQYTKDPHWFRARFPQTCSKPDCDTRINPGDRAWYWPIGRKAECEPCGQASERRFILEAQDEDFLAGVG